MRNFVSIALEARTRPQICRYAKGQRGSALARCHRPDMARTHWVRRRRWGAGRRRNCRREGKAALPLFVIKALWFGDFCLSALKLRAVLAPSPAVASDRPGAFALIATSGPTSRAASGIGPIGAFCQRSPVYSPEASSNPSAYANFASSLASASRRAVSSTDRSKEPPRLLVRARSRSERRNGTAVIQRAPT